MSIKCGPLAGLAAALLAASLVGCASSSSAPPLASASPTAAASSTLPATPAPSSDDVSSSATAAPTGAAQPTGAPPAEAKGYGARAAVQVQGPQVYFFFPAPGTLTEPDCIHGEIRPIPEGQATSRWTTTLCGYPDPANPGYTRYYDWNNGQYRDTQWVLTMGQGTDGWVYEQDRWSLSGPKDVWFRYKPDNTAYTEISVTAWGAPWSGFESVQSYHQRYPDYASQEELRLAVAAASMLVMELQVFHLSGPAPYTEAEISNAEVAASVPPALQNINNNALDRILATDPVGRIAAS